MKVRSDFVSNSSSASFIIQSGAADALRKFVETFGNAADEMGCISDSWVEKNDKTYVDLLDFIAARSPYDDVTAVVFETDNHNKEGMLTLAYLRRYFDGLGFDTDASDSERPFMHLLDNGDPMPYLFKKANYESKK